MRILWLWLILCLCLPARADDRSQILAMGRPQGRVLLLLISRPWALVAYQPPHNEPACTYLLRRSQQGHWRVAIGGGGAMGAPELFLYGVPRAQWPALLKYRPAAAEVKRALAAGPIWPQDSREELMTTELAGLSPWLLSLRRNELLARHGYVFQQPALHQYFSQRAWYRPNPKCKLGCLTAVESTNARTLEQFQKEAGLPDY